MADTDEQWTSTIEKYANGQDDFDALCRHYSDEGNFSHRSATEDRLRETFHYKSKRALSFNVFLDRMHKMFNIFYNDG